MSVKLNEWKLFGAFVTDPRMKETRTGTLLCRRVISVPRGWHNPDTGLYEESHDEFELCAWGRVAEDMEAVRHGTPVLVIGKLKLERWTDNGEMRQSMRLAVDSVQAACEVSE
jgi:single-stranded DNA-binding protein